MSITGSKTVFAILMLSLLYSCGTEQAPRQGFRVRGKITNLDKREVSLNELTPKGLIYIDTAVVSEDGSFEFNGSLNEKTFCVISLPKGAVVLVLDSASDITLSVDANDVDNYGLNGSPENDELRKLLHTNSTYMQRVKQIENKYARAGDDVPPLSVQEQIRAEYDSLMHQRNRELEAFASGSNSIVAYFVTDFLMPDADFAFLESIDKKMNTRFPASKYAQELHVRVEKLRHTAIGQAAPDIVLPDPFGKTTTLSSLRGKYVLIDFWASWCRPCREESPRLVKVYNRFKSFGFEVFSVSLDDDKDAWTRAINDDGLLWTHVSDLKKWNSDIVVQYNIDAIPFTVLLNKDGKIIAKNLRGEELEKKIEEAIRESL